MIPWLDALDPFPPVETALVEPNGLLAAGGDLSPQRLLAAYRQGIFPWFSAGEPILWWSPDPRMVLFPGEIRISRSLRRRLRQGDYRIHLDTAFDQVMAACAEPRAGAGGTWITAEMRKAYGALHRLGYAHSVETWIDGELAGGLYGVALGRVFYGESMFSRVTDASKLALAHLSQYLESLGFGVIDCQMTTGHLASLGGREIPRKEFAALIGRLAGSGRDPGRWPPHAAQALFRSGTATESSP